MLANPFLHYQHNNCLESLTGYYCDEDGMGHFMYEYSTKVVVVVVVGVVVVVAAAVVLMIMNTSRKRSVIPRVDRRLRYC
jgi:hypothetical protein